MAYLLMSSWSGLSLWLALSNAIAWIVLTVFLRSHFRLLDSARVTLKEIDFPEKVAGSLRGGVFHFFEALSRYYRVTYGVRLEENLEQQDLEAQLRKIAFLAYTELQAKAVKISLIDEVSGLHSQSILLGEPNSLSSQPTVLDARYGRKSGTGNQAIDLSVMSQPIVFSGNTFGTIRVELPKDQVPSDVDLHMLTLLANQAALVLIDARFTEELLRMRRAGEESIQAKTGFLANLSHEIRGPLGIILNGVELVMDELCGPVSDDQRETLDMVKQSGDHLLDLVNDVLDYAKAEAGKVKPKTVEIDLKDLLDDLASVVRTQAMTKKHQLQVEAIEEGLGMLCDKRHARQMLINFLTNAIKYTPEGGEIFVKAEPINEERVRVSVQDNGVGIPEEQKPRVFGAFERVETQYSLAQAGTGLGMPLTRRLAEVNGGQVDFSSQEGQGSTFWIDMPKVEISAAEDLIETEIRTDGPLGNGEAILVFDDGEQASQMLTRYLKDQGFTTIHARSPQQVLKVLQEEAVELAVVENDLPEVSGEDIVTVIRSTPQATSVPIILLSARAFVFDIEHFLKLGVDRCLSKPVELSEIASTARRLIDETRSYTA